MRRWHQRWWVMVVIVLGVLCVAVAVTRQPLTRWATRRSLSKIQGYRADFLDARVSFLPLSYTIARLELVPDDTTLPIFYVERLESGVFARDIIRGHLRAWANVEKAKITFFLIPIHIPDIAAILRQVIPFEISRDQLKDGELTVALRHHRVPDRNRPEGSGPQLWFHDIESTIEGLTTRPELGEGATTLVLRCAMQRSGTVQIFLTADLLSTKGLTFSGQTDLRGLEVSDLDAILEQAGVKAAGTFDLLARFMAKNGRLSGGLQPVLKNGKVESVNEDPGNKLRASLADARIKLASDRVPGRNAVATVIPIQGTINHPKLDLGPAILGVMRNAFVEGLSESLAKLPAPRPERSAKPPRAGRLSAGARP